MTTTGNFPVWFAVIGSNPERKKAMFTCRITTKTEPTKMFQGFGTTEEEATDAAWNKVLKVFHQTFGDDWPNHPDEPEYPDKSNFNFDAKRIQGPVPAKYLEREQTQKEKERASWAPPERKPGRKKD